MIQQLLRDLPIVRTPEIQALTPLRATALLYEGIRQLPPARLEAPLPYVKDGIPPAQVQPASLDETDEPAIEEPPVLPAPPELEPDQPRHSLKHRFRH